MKTVIVFFISLIVPDSLVLVDMIFNYLVVEPTHLKNMLVKLDHFPKDPG